MFIEVMVVLLILVWLFFRDDFTSEIDDLWFWTRKKCSQIAFFQKVWFFCNFFESKQKQVRERRQQCVKERHKKIKIRCITSQQIIASKKTNQKTKNRNRKKKTDTKITQSISPHYVAIREHKFSVARCCSITGAGAIRYRLSDQIRFGLCGWLIEFDSSQPTSAEVQPEVVYRSERSRFFQPSESGAAIKEKVSHSAMNRRWLILFLHRGTNYTPAGEGFESGKRWG